MRIIILVSFPYPAELYGHAGGAERVVTPRLPVPLAFLYHLPQPTEQTSDEIMYSLPQNLRYVLV